jgi:hypothetical protein
VSRLSGAFTVVARMKLQNTNSKALSTAGIEKRPPRVTLKLHLCDIARRDFAIGMSSLGTPRRQLCGGDGNNPDQNWRVARL